MSHIPTEPTLPPGLPDDWVMPTDVECPSCHYNLRMLRTPRCPECGSVFRWQTLLHIRCPRCDQPLHEIDDEQCPRCGLPLAWRLLLDQADAIDANLYEYTRRPIGAAVGAFTAALNPFTFWRRRPLEAPPVVKRLRRLRMVAVIVAIAGLVLLSELDAGIYWLRIWLDIDSLRVLLPRFAVVLTLPIVTMIALPMFTPTLARFRLRRDRLLRLMAYGCAGMWWIGAVLIVASAAGHAWNEFGATMRPRMIINAMTVPLSNEIFFSGEVVLDLITHGRVMPRGGWYCPPTAHWFSLEVAALIAIFAFVWWWLFLYTGLRRYLRIDRGNAVALFASTQVIALLVLAILLLLNTAIAETAGRMLIGR